MSRPADDPLTVVHLLGAPSRPTDGVADHADALAGALRGLGRRSSVVRCAWARRGWFRALRATRDRLRDADRVLLHHTNLGWSRHGFPFGVLAAAAVVGRRRLWVLFHDPLPFPRAGIGGRPRAFVQVTVMRMLTMLAARAYSTIDPSCIPWARGRSRRRIALLPVGSNVGANAGVATRTDASRPFTVAVFSITENGRHEARQIARVVTLAEQTLGAELRLLCFGGGVEGARPWLEHDVGPGVEVVASGVAPTARVAGSLREADVQLFIRGAASSRRGTLVAGIAHLVPVVAFSGPETCWPITEAGVALVPFGDLDAAADAVVRIATDRAWATRLREMSEIAYERYFSWERVASNLLDGGLRP